MENKWYFIWKPQNVYSVWKLLSFVTERDTAFSKVGAEVEKEFIITYFRIRPS